MAFIEVMPVTGGKHLINTKYIVYIEEDNLSGCIIHLKYGAEGGTMKNVHTKVSLASVLSDISKTAVSTVR
ncbi:MAG: hypothetical protein C0508_09045 [Cyanobacteria bacterium PR.023]|jgi:hypothetical protein|nr:hypothetical protein [Cyanobacteria bacterium PR.023]MDQ5933283.1 hypothetical protein [Cyanobacteriota bacterium erpe_2018_sw_21hr_WHONDRS-SW48-000092_B_bin.40]